MKAYLVATDGTAGDAPAMQLRARWTMTEVAADRHSKLVFPAPIELLRFIDTAGHSRWAAGKG